MSGLDATAELDPAEVLGVRIPACITRVYAEAPTFSSFATAFTIGKSPLRQACHDFQQLADDGAESGAMSADLVTIATRAFRLACDNKTSKLCEPALEGLKLLCATGMIAGSTKAWAPKPKDAPSDENDKEDTDKEDASKTDEEQAKEDELVSLVTAVAKCGEVSSSSTHVACVACIASMAESKSFALRGESLATAARTLLHLSVAALSDDDQVAAKAALVRVINEAFARAEPSFTSRDGESDEANEANETNESIESSDECDALLLTLTLCAIAAKPLDGSNDEYKSHSRVLAMDLIRQLLEGPVAGAWLARWRVHLRKPLCVAILRAGAGGLDRDGSVQALETRYLGVAGSNPGGVVGSGNPSPKVAKALAPLRALARAAFGVVIIKARKSYKREISALYAPLALAPLEAPAAQSNADGSNTDPDHQLVALRLVRKLASDPQVLVDVFVNYDCDLNGENLYERTLGALAGAMTPGKGPKQAVRNGALQCVLAMVQSLRVWHARGEAGGGELGESDESKENGGSLRKDPATPVKDTSSGEKADAADADSEANKFHQMKARKASVEAAVAGFNARPKLTSLESCPDLKTDDPTQVASFLLTAKGLDKTAIGELLGGFDDDEVAVMRAFVESHDFAQDDFDVALRRFMSSFRLPGEAQKIDRLMEAFAARYCEGNPDVFKDPDAAYVLAFAVIMLNTDAHNPNMDTKMTKKDFVDMATSAESGSGMDQAMLETVYDRIVSEEIVMKDEPPNPKSTVNRKKSSSLGKSLNLATPWARRDTVSAARAKSETVMKETRSLYTANDGSVESTEYEPAFHAASEPGLARPMLDAASTPLLGALRKAFECAEDAGHAALPLECARAAFRLANRVQLPEMRDQLAAFLTSAPGIGRQDGMAPQGAEAVMTLLEVAVGESGMPGTCWAAVLEVVSGLDELHAAAHGGCGIPSPDEGVSSNASIAGVQSPTSSLTLTPGAGLEASRTPPGPVSRASRTASGVTNAALSEYPLAPGTSGHMNVDSAPGSPSAVNTSNAPTSAEKNLNSAEKNLAAWLGGAGADAVERVFSGSTRLDSEEIVVFTQALAHVASAELTRPDGTYRTFSLRKLVHVVLHNSGRVRLAWSRVWGVASECLVAACAHVDADVVAVAAGGLKQVAYRVLSNAPVSSDRSDVLKPFVSAFKAAKGVQSDQSRCAIADALGGALADGNGLALGVTGWRSVMEVLEIASADPSRSVALSALRGVSTAVVETNREKPNALVDCDAVRAIARFAYIPHEGTADGDQSMAVSAVSPLDATSLRLVELSAETLRDVAVDAGRALSSSPYANDSTNRTGDEASEPPLDDRERAMGTWRIALASLADAAAGDRLSSSPYANDSEFAVNKSLFVPPPPEPALRGLFKALDAFVGGGEDVVQLPADAWKVAADVAIKPTVDMESRRLRLLETTRTSAVGAMKTAMEWSSRRARHSLVPLCRIVATLEDGPCRDALLEPLLEALPSMAGVSDQELAAHAVSAAKHVAAALSATGVLNPQTVDSPVNVARWDGVVAVFASAVASASEKTDKRKTRDETAGGAVAALLATRAAAETLARSPPTSTPHASRAKLLNLLRDAYHDAAAVSAQHGDDRHARLEVTAGELLLDALVGELDDARASKQCDENEKSAWERDLAGMLRQHVRESLRAAAAVAGVRAGGVSASSSPSTKGGDKGDKGGDKIGDNKIDGSPDADVTNVTAAARNLGSLDDGGAGWLEHAARTRAAGAFREPLAAAAIRALTNLASVDPKLFGVCVRECAQSACALVGVGRNPVAKELADLFAGPIADVLVPFAAGVTNGNGRGETPEGEKEDGVEVDEEDHPSTPLKPVDVSKPDHSPVPIGSPGSRGDGVLEPAAEERPEDLA